MKRQLTIWFILTGAFVLALAACAPSTVANPDEEPSYLPAEKEETAVPQPTDEVEATAVPLPPDDLPAITRESTDDLAPATIVPEAAISQPEDKVMTPPPPAGPDNTPTEDEFVRMAKEDLSQRLDVPPEEIELVSYEEMQWRDGSLGCPQPKMRYIQVITPGYRIQLKADDRLYSYHGAANREPFLCTLKVGSQEFPISPNLDQ